MNYAKSVSRKTTPPNEPATSTQVENNAGGFVFAVDKWAMLDRFLLLGSEGNTYYATEKKMTRDNARNVEACICEDGRRVVDRVVEISKAGRAPKNDPAIFVLALAASAQDFAEAPAVRKYALDQLNVVCRIGTHLFTFVAAVNELRGWGRQLQGAIENWYQSKPVDTLAQQVLKYQSRNEWSHRDVLRLVHPKATHDGYAAVYEWIRAGAGPEAFPVEGRTVKRGKGAAAPTRQYRGVLRTKLPEILSAYEELKAAEDAKTVIRLIETQGFTREMIPTAWLNDVTVWEALLFGNVVAGITNEDRKVTMPMTAMIRNLGKMGAVGLLKPFSKAAKAVAERLGDRAAIRQARIHPLQLFSALHVYGQGHGDKGSLTWTPVTPIAEALHSAFYAAFETIEPTNKNWLLAIDVSASMGQGEVAGMAGITPCIAAAIMAMVTARVEKNYHAVGFCHHLVPLHFSPSDRLDTVMSKMNGLPFGSTDCSAPMLYAARENLDVDAFVILTDNEVNTGRMHSFQALKAYRAKSGRNAKMIVQAFTSTGFTIADPSDAGSLDIVGLDTATPAIMSEFVKGA